MDRRAFLGATATLSTPFVAGCSGGGGGGDDGDGVGGDDVETTTGTTTAGGGDGGDDEEEAPPAETTVAETATPRTTTAGATGAQAAYPNFNWEQLEGVEPTAATTVTMRNVAFHPLVARVDAGTEVTFPNEDASVHTVTIPALDVDELVQAGERASVSFDEPGTFDYVCTFHPPDMLGRVIVE